MLIKIVLYHVNSLLTHIWYKAIYGSRFCIDGVLNARKDFNLLIEKDAKVLIGKGCFFNNHCSINCRKKVTIGNHCLFGEDVKIYDHNHRFRSPDTPIARQGFKEQEVVIGDNCWIGSNVVVLRGVVIGDNVVIGAGCVVQHDVPSRTIVKTSTVSELISW